MGTHLIPREVTGEGRILYIFTAKGFLFTLIGMAIGAIFKSICDSFGANIAGWIFLALFGAIGWGIGQGVIPDVNTNNFFRKVGGMPVDAIIKNYFKFNRNKKIYVTKVTVDNTNDITNDKGGEADDSRK